MLGFALKGLAGRLGRNGLVRALTVGVLVMAFGLAGPSPVASRQSEVRRVALVITNNAAGADVGPGGEAIVRKLTALGYDVVPALNANQRELDRAIGRMDDRVSAETVVVIYYAGFAVRANNEDWFVPAGAAPASASDLPTLALPVKATVRGFRDKGAVVAVFIDGCRQSPITNALGGVCAGDTSGRDRDIYLVSSAFRMNPGDLTNQMPGLFVEGRTIGKMFDEVVSRFGTSAVVEVPGTPTARASLTVASPARPVAAPTPPPAAPSTTATPQPAPMATGGVPMSDFLQDAIARADYGDREGAQKRAAELPARYGDLIGTLSPRDRLVFSAQVAYINGDYAGAARDFEASRAMETSGGADALRGGVEARRSRLQGSAYIQLGRYKEAITLLEQSARLYREFMAADEERSAMLLAPVWTRLGEAYRLDGRLGDARRTLEEAVRTNSGAAKGAAFLQMARLCYDERNWDAAEGFGRNASVDLLKASAKAGVADAYVIVGRAIYRKRPEAEGEAWRYYDLALEYDPQSVSAKVLRAELPTRLALPPFESMRPTFRFNRTVESRALTCYPSAVERDAYLGQVKAEMDALYNYGIRINDYIAKLWTMLSGYEQHGYLEDYQDVLRGRGYRFRAAIIDEEAGWKARREMVLARHAALTQWHGYAGGVTIPCKPEAPAVQLSPPGGYQPRLPPRDDYVASASTPSPAPAPPPAPPSVAKPMTLASASPPPASPPPQVVSPPPAQSPPPAPKPEPAPPPAAKPAVSTTAPPAPAAVAPPPKPIVTSPPPASPPPAPSPTPAKPPSAPPQVAAAPPPTASPAKPDPALPDLFARAGQPSKPAPTQAAAAKPPETVATAAPPPTPKPAAAPPVQTVAAVASPKVDAPAASPPPPAPKPVALPPTQTVAALTPPRTSAPAGPAVVAPPPAVAATPPAPQPVPAAPAASSYVTPPAIIFASAPATLPPAALPPAPAAKGKPAPPKPSGAALAKLALERGAVFIGQGKYDLAQREFATAAENDPGNEEAQAGLLAARGLGRLQGGQISLAIDDLTASRTARPIPEALEGLARIYAANSNRGAAIDLYSEAIRMRPGYAQALFGRAEAQRERATPLRDEAELRAAEADYKAALAAKGDVPEALMGLGMTRFALGDFAGAVESADAALRVRPIFPDAKYVRARSRFELGQNQETLKDLVDLPAGFDVYARACSTGMAFSAMGDAALGAKDEPRAIELYGQAAQAFQQAVAARPGDTRSKFWFDSSTQNALPGILGKGKRSIWMTQVRLQANRKGPSPTATLVREDACKRT